MSNIFHTHVYKPYDYVMIVTGLMMKVFSFKMQMLYEIMKGRRDIITILRDLAKSAMHRG